MTFITPPNKVFTNAATNITATSAWLNATVIAVAGYSVDWTFEYGLTTSYNYGGGGGTVSSGTDTPVYMTGGGIAPNTTYHYRVDGCYYLTSAGNSNCTTIVGADMQFTTLAVIVAPTTQALNITFPANLNSTQKSFSWTNGNGTKRAVFVKQANTGTVTPANNTTYTASTAFTSGTQISTSGWYCVYNGTGTTVTVTGLTAGTDYIAQVFEYNGSAGAEKYLTSTATNNPKSERTIFNSSATTYAATSIGATTATVNGFVTNGGPASLYHFEYGTTVSYGSLDNPVNNTIAFNDSATVSCNLIGLTANTIYHYRCVFIDDNSVAHNGADMNFTTQSNPVQVTATLGTVSRSYTTLKAAFDKINDGTHKGAITITIVANTTETATAALNASGNGSASYSSVNIYPTVTGLSISGSIDAPLIDLNGADNVTIDGRVNATGFTKDLVIYNTSTSYAAGTSTIRFINDASNNTIRYCTIKGSSMDASAGIVFFSSTTGTLGNSNNIIDHNDITNAVDANRPINAIFSYGTATYVNTTNTISNNNIYDFLNTANASNGINISSNSTDWNIIANSFYETTLFVPTSNVNYYSIYIYNISGNNFNITDNTIGGNSSDQSGKWTVNSAYSNAYYGIYIQAGATTASSVQNNTIKNFDYTTAVSSWYGIYVGGKVNVGTVTGNTIGSTNGTGSITLTNTSSSSFSYGITIGGGNIDVEKNKIGSVTVIGTASNTTYNFTGISKTISTGTVTISNNIIGSTTDANSINAISPTTFSQNVTGIFCGGTGPSLTLKTLTPP